jgi:hypothetical protein
LTTVVKNEENGGRRRLDQKGLYDDGRHKDRKSAAEFFTRFKAALNSVVFEECAVQLEAMTVSGWSFPFSSSTTALQARPRCLQEPHCCDNRDLRL